MEENDLKTKMSLLSAAGVDVLTLFLLGQKPMYTYDLANEIKKLSSDMLPVPKLYNTITRLKAAGLIKEHDKEIIGNRIRIYYIITEEGESQLKETRTLLNFLNKTLNDDKQHYTENNNDGK